MSSCPSTCWTLHTRSLTDRPRCSADTYKILTSSGTSLAFGSLRLALNSPSTALIEQSEHTKENAGDCSERVSIPCTGSASSSYGFCDYRSNYLVLRASMRLRWKNHFLENC